MAKPSAQTVQQDRVPNTRGFEKTVLAESTVNQGMITMLDPADIPNGALQLAKNATVRFDRTSRRPGSILLVPVKPNSSPILRLAYVKRNNGDAYTFRFTHTSLHSLGVGWNAYAGALTGTRYDRIQTAYVDDRFIFSNNGADEIQEVDFSLQTFGPLGNAPQFRYITGFADRAVGAALRGTNEVLIGWSGNRNIDEWNGAVDESAGNSPLVDSPADLSDYITGLFGLTNVMAILREKSLWLATKQPIPQQPFYFFPAVPGIGCDSPSSACVVQNGLAWLDRNSGSVYAWGAQPGAQPEPIGRPIEKTILDNVNDPAQIFAAYAPIPKEYSICIPQVGSNYVNVWTYSFRNKAWVQHEYYALTSIDDVELANAGLTIDQLGDVPIDDLTGTIDELSPTSTIINNLTFGRDDGSIAIEDINADTDAPHTDFPAGITYQTITTSKAFKVPRYDHYVSEVIIEYEARRGGTFRLEYSRTGGGNDTDWTLAKEVEYTQLGEPLILRYNRMIRSTRFAWRLVSSNGLFDILSYEVHMYRANETRQS